MQIITRAKNILLSPASEWAAISAETDTPQSLLGKYVIPMALIPALALFIGYGLIGFEILGSHIGNLGWGLTMGIKSLVSTILSYFLSTYVVDALAPNFSSQKDLGRSAQLVAYSSTAVWVAGIFYIIPSLWFLSILGLYGIYLFYLGIPAMKKTPDDKRIIYMIVSAVVIAVISYVVILVVDRIVYAVSGNPFLGGTGGMGDMLR
jgi:hypothetical protein